jgi:hypothetical protein
MKLLLIYIIVRRGLFLVRGYIRLKVSDNEVFWIIFALKKDDARDI